MKTQETSHLGETSTELGRYVVVLCQAVPLLLLLAAAVILVFARVLAAVLDVEIELKEVDEIWNAVVAIRPWVFEIQLHIKDYNCCIYKYHLIYIFISCLKW